MTSRSIHSLIPLPSATSNSPIIKVCGMRDATNIKAVEKASPDWMGFIFYPRSVRYVENKPSYLPRHTKRVGVFVHPQIRDVAAHVRCYGLQAVQFHGEASPDLCVFFRERGLTVIRALPVSPAYVSTVASYAGMVDYFLFDTPTLGFGGSGRSYDWHLLQLYEGPVPFLLSGGLSLQMVERLKQFAHPFLAGYDINSGFEIAPALKDDKAIAQFVFEMKQQSNRQ